MKLSRAYRPALPHFPFSIIFPNVDAKPEVKNHYRGHKLSMWLSLIPQIHSPGDSPDISMRHHHFSEENPQFYDGKWTLSIKFYECLHFFPSSSILKEKYESRD